MTRPDLFTLALLDWFETILHALDDAYNRKLWARYGKHHRE